MRLFFIISFLSFLHLGINCQQYATGLILDEGAYRSIPRQSLYGDGGKSEDKVLEGVYKVDLKPYCPRPRHQGSIASCVGWSCGYAAMTIANAVRDNMAGKQAEIDNTANSALFIYNQIKIAECESGSRIEDALQLMLDKGNTLSRDFDIVAENCNRKPNRDDFEKATSFRILDFMTLFGQEDSDLIKINKIKVSLVKKKPVIVALELKENFLQLKKGDLYWFPQIGNTNPMGAHAMCVVGFDDGKEAFEIMNSWGDYWGEDGFIWIKYDDFVKYCYRAYQFSLPVKTIPTKEIQNLVSETMGVFAFRYPKSTFNGSVEFEYANVVHAEDRYKLEKKDWQIGSKFQLVSTSVQAGMYLYVFSFDPNGELKVHWPRDENLDSKFTGIIESALITTPEIELVIPGQTKALQYNDVGSDFTVVLYAKQPIKNINEKLASLKKEKKGDFIKKLYKSFGKELAPIKEIEYSPNTMGCKSKSKLYTIFPLVLEVVVIDRI